MKITVNNLPWEIILEEQGNENLIKDGDPCFGCTHYDKLKIYLDEALSIPLLHQILIHELTHVYLFSYGIHISPDDTEECICDFLGAFLDEINEKVLAVEKKIKKNKS